MSYRLYIRIKIQEATVKEYIQWMLLYMQKRIVDVQKENTLENLEERVLEYETVGEFLADIRKEFREGGKESVKVAELKELEQGRKTIEKFVQEFRRAARESRYKGRSLVEEFKRGINTTICICQRLMKLE